MAKAWGMAKSSNRDSNLSPMKLICYQKYLATKIKFIGIKYWQLLGQILFFRDKNSYFCQWNISLENTFSDKFYFIKENFRRRNKIFVTKLLATGLGRRTRHERIFIGECFCRQNLDFQWQNILSLKVNFLVVFIVRWFCPEKIFVIL